jgi:hypothetical protein
VAWKHACRSKEDKGLRIINLRNHNSTLLMKFLHKFYNNLDLPWVKLPWEKLYKNGRPPMKGSMWVIFGGGILCPWHLCVYATSLFLF